MIGLKTKETQTIKNRIREAAHNYLMINTSSYPPFPNLAEWSRVQAEFARHPLEYCADFPRIAARHEAWWRCELEGPPLVLAAVTTDPSVIGGRRLELLSHPEAWMAARLAQLKTTHLVGDALPAIRVDYGPVCLGMLMGAPVDFISDTTWTQRFVSDDWSNARDWEIHEDNPWWQLLARLLKLNAENAKGRYVAMTPSLGGTADVLLNFRGAEQLCMDIVDQPEEIAKAVEAIYPIWHKGFERIWGEPLAMGVGTINWVGLWSNRPYHVLECDFNFLIGSQAFQGLFLPDLARQARDVGRGIFHLDGPGAAKHYLALLDKPEITAIQYTTGAGNSVLTHLEMLRQIQERGRPLQVNVPAKEAVELSRKLDPTGLCLCVEVGGDLDPHGLDNLYRDICKPFR